MPYPPDKGERIRAFHELKALSKSFRITLAALTHNKEDYESANAVQAWCERILLAPAGGKAGLVRGLSRIIKGKSVTEGYFHSRQLTDRLGKLLSDKHYPIALAYSSSMLPYLFKANVAHRVIDLVDVDSAKWFAYAGESSWPKKWAYQREGRIVRQLEEDAIIRCDAVLVVSDAESAVLGNYPRKLGVLGNGVDSDYFMAETNSHKGAASLVFTGTMDYRPNVEGVCWFVDKVWAGLKRQIPELTFCIVGRDPTPVVRRLAEHSGVEVTGTVGDVRPYLSSASVAICPLLIARGIQNKILEAMAMSRAVVSSGPGLEGLDVEIGRDVLQADTPEQWQEGIRRLLEDESYRATMGQSARRCVEARYNWDVRMAPLVSLCQRLVSTPDESESVSTTVPRAPASARNKVVPKKEIHRKDKRYPVNKRVAVALWLMTFAYGVVLAGGNLLPSGKRLPLLGVWDASMSATTQNMLHMPAYALLMVCVSLSMSASLRKRSLAIVLAIVITFGVGILMEYAQGSVPGRTVSNIDIMLNGIGIALALPAAISWRWRHTSYGMDDEDV